MDDEEQLRKLLSRIIGLEGFAVREAATLKSANESLQQYPADVILCDVRLPDGNGVDYVSRIKKDHPLSEIILLTAYGNIPDGVQAIKNGAFDYIVKGNDNDRIIPLLHQALRRVQEQKNASVKISDKGSTGFESIIGNGKQIQEAVKLAKMVAPTDTSVLLLGETGTGKEVFAHAIHSASKRNTKPFIALNCSAFAKDLLEGELFGHKAGAYTGALKDKKGLIELADKGTLFLDEIGEMNIDLQAKLLRVIENGEFIKLGDTRTTKVDVRIIAATNRHLDEAIANGSFREDLYYRLNVFSITLPSLRERPADIAALADHFLSTLPAKDAAALTLDRRALQLMQQYSWKGNVRELKNTLERASILSDDGVILPEHLPYELQSQDDQAGDNLSLATVEKKHIQKVLQHTSGNKTKTAELLGIGLTTLYRKMEEYGLPK